MDSPHEQFKINLNQNLWGLVVGLAALGLAEYFRLCTLYWFAFVAAAVMLASVAATTLAYTINYWKNKQPRGEKKA